MGRASEEPCPSEEAAAWMWKLDRGLTGAEQDSFLDWLTSDSQNAELMTEQRSNWKRLNALVMLRTAGTPNPDLLAACGVGSLADTRRRGLWLPILALTLLLAGSLAYLGLSDGEKAQSIEPIAASPVRLTLEDGSILKLKDATQIETRFTDGERRVRLQGGEAFFIVAKDAGRPFIVETNNFAIKALGTSFNVKQDPTQCEILVTEGVVELISQGEPGLAKDTPHRLSAYQKAVVHCEAPSFSPAVAVVSPSEAVERLRSHHAMLTFDATPLAEIVYEINLLNETQLVLSDKQLEKTLFQGSFHSGDIDSFVETLQVDYHLTAQHATHEGQILLSQGL